MDETEPACHGCWYAAQITCVAGQLWLYCNCRCSPAGPIIQQVIGTVDDCSNFYISTTVEVICHDPAVCGCITNYGPIAITVTKGS